MRKADVEWNDENNLLHRRGGQKANSRNHKLVKQNGPHSIINENTINLKSGGFEREEEKRKCVEYLRI